MTPIELLKRKPVYFYTDTDIAPYGQGSAIRLYTNLRAYLDLGFNVEIIQFVNKCDKTRPFFDISGPNIKLTIVEYESRPANIFQRLAFYLGFPRKAVLDVLFPIRNFVVKQVKHYHQLQPDAIHHFEYDHMASAVVGYKNLDAIWSNHDIFSTRIPLLWEMRKEFLTLQMSEYYRHIRLARLRSSENWIAGCSKLILNIAEHEQDEFRNLRSYLNAELFPMSWPDETIQPRLRGWMKDGKLHLLHLGNVDGFVGYDSLRYILEKVFPLLPANILNSIELFVAGRMGQTKYSQYILELAATYPQVKFLGYVEDIKQLYSIVDLQVVGNLRATGLRTRIIESFVYGLPVLSTEASANGIVSLNNNFNIFLVTDAKAFKDKIIQLISNPNILEYVATNARKTYDQYYSRYVAAGKLSKYLEKYL